VHDAVRAKLVTWKYTTEGGKERLDVRGIRSGVGGIALEVGIGGSE
jgi:hypothetical protein